MDITFGKNLQKINFFTKDFRFLVIYIHKGNKSLI